ncbi:hypothetical protein SLS56_011165 [Neofusicoccum ribis]|uniref:MFS transporter n=1 Tax=Neofusicoccum ribis TaxID=45134 RepID=A0ABR3SCD1_9PEZI
MPVGAQRSTYWLQLPYRFALPMVGLSTALHYFTSQAVFFAQIRVFENTLAAANTTDTINDKNNNNTNSVAQGEQEGLAIVKQDVSGLGFSNAALLALAVCATGFIVVTLVVGLKRGHCSDVPPARVGWEGA